MSFQEDHNSKIAWQSWFIMIGYALILSVAWYWNYEASQIDNAQTLTFMKMFKDASLYHQDFFLRTAYGVHLFSLYYVLAAAIGSVFDPYWGLYGYFIVINCLCVCGIFYLAHTITKNNIASYLSVVALTLQWQWAHALGGSAALGIGPFPDQLATGLMLFSMALYLRERRVWAFGLAGLTFGVHPSFSIFLVSMLCYALMLRRNWKWLFLGTIIYTIVAVPFIAYIASNALPTNGQLEFTEWYRILQLRSASHTMPFSWGFGVYAKFIPYLFIFVLGFRLGKRFADRDDASLYTDTLGFTLGIALLCTVGLVFAELIPIASVIKMTLFRSTRFFVILAVVLYIDVGVRYFERPGLRKYGHMALLASLITASFPMLYVSIMVLYVASLRAKDKYAAYVSVIIMAVLAVIALKHYGIAVILDKGNLAICCLLMALFVLGGIGHWRRFRCYLVGAGVVIFLFVGNVYYAYSDAKYFSAVKNVQLWIRDHTSSGEMVVYPPYSYIWSGLSERGDFFNYCQLGYVIYTPFLGQQVVQRASEYVGDLQKYASSRELERAFRQSYNAWTDNKYITIAKRYGVSYAVVENHRNIAFPLLFQNEYFKVYDLSPDRKLTDL